MSFLYFLERLRNPVCDFFFLTVTHLGEELAFLAIALLFFWCVNKRQGYYMLMTGFFGLAINQTLKITLKIRRPWQIDPNFSPISGAIAEATGYSFPSGHTQTACGTFGVIATVAKRRAVKVLAIVIAFLVAFSRMYLGVHTPWDVLASVGVATFLIVVLEPFFSTDEKMRRSMPYMIGLIVTISCAYLIYSAIVYNADLEESNFISGFQSGCTLVGCALGFIPVYIMDNRFTKFSTEGKWYSQIIKVVIGVALTIALKELLKIALVPILGHFYERILRYFLIVVFAGGIWPMTFGFFSSLKIDALDRFGDKVVDLFRNLFNTLKIKLKRLICKQK